MNLYNFIYEHLGTLFIIAVILGLMFLAVLFMVAVGKGNQKYDMMVNDWYKQKKGDKGNGSDEHFESCIPLKYQKESRDND